MSASASSDPSARPRTGWTGGQYALFRGLLAIEIASALWLRFSGVEGGDVPAGVTGLLGVGLAGCVALGLGYRDRWAALGLFVLLSVGAGLADGAPLVLPRRDVIVDSLLLLLHLATPRSPFGAWDARGRADPAGSWSLSLRVHHAAWGLLAIGHGLAALSILLGLPQSYATLHFGAVTSVRLLLELAVVAAALRPRMRPAVWIAFAIWQLGWIAAFGSEEGESSVWLLHLLAFDPRWLPGISIHAARGGGDDRIAADARARLFYDGDCGLCHRSVRFILAEEANAPEALRLRFAPLASASFAAFTTRHPELEAGRLPDSIVLDLGDGRVLVRAAAVIEIGGRLGGLWRLLATAGGKLPRAPLDRAYDAIARLRHRIFARPDGSCPIGPPDLRGRFDG